MSRLAYVLPLAILRAGCKPTVPPPQSEAATRTETAELRETTTAPARGTDASDDITMRYGCEQGHRVDIVGGNSARVTLADGRAVDIPRIADSAPPRYAGVALSFEVGSDGATLGQDEVGGFACREAD